MIVTSVSGSKATALGSRTAALLPLLNMRLVTTLTAVSGGFEGRPVITSP